MNREKFYIKLINIIDISLSSGEVIVVAGLIEFSRSYFLPTFNWSSSELEDFIDLYEQDPSSILRLARDISLHHRIDNSGHLLQKYPSEETEKDEPESAFQSHYLLFPDVVEYPVTIDGGEFLTLELSMIPHIIPEKRKRLNGGNSARINIGELLNNNTCYDFILVYALNSRGLDTIFHDQGMTNVDIKSDFSVWYNFPRNPYDVDKIHPMFDVSKL